MPENMSIRSKIGSIFVNLTSKFYGGEISRNGNNDSETGNPDIINWKRNQAYESKASISSDHHKISPSQIDHYINLQNSKFPLDKPEVYYFLWQHKKRGVSKLKEDDLERTVIHNINRLLVISFNIVEAGRQVWDITGKDSWGETYMLRSSERRSLTENTDIELKRMDLKPEKFLITRETIPGKTYRYNHWNIPEFSITTITDRKLKGVERIV